MKEITDEPFGYYFNGRFYKSLYELRGRTMSGHSQPIPLYQHPKVEITGQEIDFIYSLIPAWAQETKPGMGETFYGTLSYEGDLKIINKVKAILSKLEGE